MIDTLSILSTLRDLYSPEESDAELVPLCAAAAKELSPRIRQQADLSDFRLINAAAATVNYRLCLKKLNSAQGVTSFKAGDVTVSVSPSVLLERAEKEKSEALLLALPLLNDDEFVFRQVCI